MQANQHFGSRARRTWRALRLALLLCALVWSAEAQPAAQNGQDSAAAQQEEPSPPGPEPLTLTEQVVRDVLEPLQRGIVERNPDHVLAVFDQQQTAGYAELRDQIRAFFSQNESVRFRYQVLQVTSEKDRGSAVAQIDMEATPMDETKMVVARSAQMSFQLRLGDKGWKLVGLKPSDFFAP